MRDSSQLETEFESYLCFERHIHSFIHSLSLFEKLANTNHIDVDVDDDVDVDLVLMLLPTLSHCLFEVKCSGTPLIGVVVFRRECNFSMNVLLCPCLCPFGGNHRVESSQLDIDSFFIIIIIIIHFFFIPSLWRPTYSVTLNH